MQPSKKYFSEKGPLNFSKNPGMTASAKPLPRHAKQLTTNTVIIPLLKPGLRTRNLEINKDTKRKAREICLELFFLSVHR